MKKNISWKVYFFLASTCVLFACNFNDKLKIGETIMVNSEKEILLKMILDHHDLQQYLHPDLPERVPVKIKSNNELGTNLSVEKFGKPIEFINSDVSARTVPMLEVVLFNIGVNKVLFEIVYDIEGVTIKGELGRNATGWVFKDFEVFES